MKTMQKGLALVLMSVLLVGGCSTAPKMTVGTVDSTPRLAIISAFQPELEALRTATKVQHTRVINGRIHYLGRLQGQDVVLVLTGYSMVNATMTAQELVDHFTLKQIIFSGIAGGVNPWLNVGDVTIPAQWGQYQEQVFARQTTNGWDTGAWNPSRSIFTNYDMMFPRQVLVARQGGPADKQVPRFWFPVYKKYLDTARRAAATVKLKSCTDKGDCLKTEPKIVIGGNGVSGQTFVDNAAYRQWVWETFHADALDMETAAVATVAYVNNVPFIGFRSLSDLAGGGSGRNEMATFFKLASDNSAAVVEAYVKALGEQP